MSLQRRMILAVFAWLAVVTVLHLWLNLHVFDFGSHSRGPGRADFRVGYLPVT